METVEVTRRSRKFGWGYSIKVPISPSYTGTINQVSGAKYKDPYYNKLDAVYNSCWFYNGKPIYAVSETGNNWERMASNNYLGHYLLLCQFAGGGRGIDKLYLQLS